MSEASQAPPPRESASDLTAPQAIILAAGKGTRMGGDLPKVLYPVAGRPMAWWVVQACLEAGVNRCVVVIGYQGQEVIAALRDIPQCVFVEQHEQLGTGHATRMAQPYFADQPAVDVFVMAGDAPLIRSRTLRQLLAAHRATDAWATLATAVLENPQGYGRVIRHEDGSFKAIVEQKDASPKQQEVCEINPSYYCFRSDRLFEALAQVKNTNAQKEYYLTDVPGLLKESGHTVTVVDAVPAQEVIGVNTQEQLTHVDQILRSRLESSTADVIEPGRST